MTEQDYFGQFLGDEPLPVISTTWEWPALTKAIFDQIVTGSRLPPEYFHVGSAMASLTPEEVAARDEQRDRLFARKPSALSHDCYQDHEWVRRDGKLWCPICHAWRAG